MRSNNNNTGHLDAEVVNWKYTSKNDPYSGNDLTANISEVLRVCISLNGSQTDFDIWHLVGTNAENYDCSYVVRGDLDTGRKSKNPISDNGQLFVTNRGKPWADNRNWTYLSESDLQRRSKIAGLGKVTPETERRGEHRLYLGIHERPLVRNGTLDEVTVEVLAKMLVIMYSGSNPA